MTIHTVVESLAAWETVRGQDPTGKRVWWSTGAAVIEALSEREEVVYSLEDGLPQEEFDRLGQAGYAFTDGLVGDLNRLCPWRGYANVGQALAFTLNQCFFVTFYKGLLLSRLVRRAIAAGERVECVGDPGVVGHAGLAMTYGRFDTLYAMLAQASGGEHAVLVQHRLPVEDLDRMHRAVVYRKMDRVEKFLSILNNTPSSFFFKAWKFLHTRNCFPLRQLRFWPVPKRRFFLYGSCELLDEVVFDILAQGSSVGFLGELPNVETLAPGSEELPDREKIAETCRVRATEALHEGGVTLDPFLGTCLDILSSRLCRSLSRLFSCFDGLTLGYQKKIAVLGSNPCLLTSGFFSVEERIFYDFCRSQKVQVVAFEHGITACLSRWTDYGDRYYGLRHADIGVYHNASSADKMGQIVPSQKRLVAGLPRATLGGSLKGFRRRVIRKWLDIPSDTHVVIYVAELEKNNYVCGPAVDNDAQYVRKTEGVVRALCKAFPTSLVILKLYPTQRYVDVHDFPNLAAEHSNLRIVKEMDFRFISQAADLIVTSSAQSTLGWVVGSGVPCLLAEFEWAPTHIDGLRMRCPDIPGLSAMIVMDTSRFITPMDPTFVSKLSM